MGWWKRFKERWVVKSHAELGFTGHELKIVAGEPPPVQGEEGIRLSELQIDKLQQSVDQLEADGRTGDEAHQHYKAQLDYWKRVEKMLKGE